MQQTHGKRLKGRNRENNAQILIFKHDKNQANGLTMTKEIGALDT